MDNALLSSMAAMAIDETIDIEQLAEQALEETMPPIYAIDYGSSNPSVTILVAPEETDIYTDDATTPSLAEIILQHGRRVDSEITVKLSVEEIKAKHEKFHEIWREHVIDCYQFAELRKEFNTRKKSRESDMAKLDNCLLRGEEVQCVSTYRIAAHNLASIMPEYEGSEEAFIFDSDFNLIGRVPLTEMERQLQFEYEDSISGSAESEHSESIPAEAE